MGKAIYYTTSAGKWQPKFVLQGKTVPGHNVHRLRRGARERCPRTPGVFAGKFRQALWVPVSPGRASFFLLVQKETKDTLRGCASGSASAPKGGASLTVGHPLRTPDLRESRMGAVSSFRRAPADTPCHARRPPAFCGCDLPPSAPPTGAWCGCSSLRVCTSNGAGTKVLRHSRRPGGVG